MKNGFKRVPAVDKCFRILELLAKSKDPLGISDISKALGYNRSTVFNIIYTLVDLGILLRRDQNKFHLGTQLYVLSRAAIRRSEFINTIHPYLEQINRETKLMAFLGIKSGLRAIIIDKIDSTFDIKVMSEVGMRIPLLAGAGGKALLSRLPDDEIDKILSKNELKPFTRFSCIDKETYKAMIQKTRDEGIAYDMEEYLEGIRAFAVPLKLHRQDLVAAIWVVGLKDQIKDEYIESYSEFIKGISNKIEALYALM